MTTPTKCIFNPFTGTFQYLTNLDPILALNNAQEIHIDGTAGSDTLNTGSVLSPFKTFAKAVTLVTDPSKAYIFYVAPGDYNEPALSIPGNVSIAGENVAIQFDATIVFGAGSQSFPVYSGVSFSNIVMDLTPAAIALPVFKGGSGSVITRLDATTGPHFIQIYDCSINALDLTGGAAVNNALFTGTCNVRNNGQLLVSNSIVGIAITAEELATISLIGSTFTGSITGTTVGVDTTTVRGDATSIGFGGTITGCNFQYLDDSFNMKYVPTTPSDWVVTPIQLGDAVDVLAATKFDKPTGVASQYIRGDGTLANFPTTSGGGSSVSYYLNGGIASDVATYYQMSKTPVVGSNADFVVNSGITTLAAQFMTDAGDPNLLNIPAGNWNFELFFSANFGGGSPTFYVELYKYDGVSSTLISSGSSFPKHITAGTAIDLYTTAIAIPSTSLTLTDRLEVRVYVTRSGRNITLHTQDSHLCQIITTFSTGLNALNGQTEQVQYLSTGTTGTDFNISSTAGTHEFNIPTASTSARGLLSSTDHDAFTAKVNTASNLGLGDGVFKQKTGTDLEFKSLKAGSNVTITPGPDEIEIAVSSSAGVNDAVNLGTGEGIYTSNIPSPGGIGLGLKSLVAGTGIGLSSTGTEITISGSGVPILLEVFNLTLTNATVQNGYAHFRSPNSANLDGIYGTFSVLQIFEKNGITSGSLTIDVKRGTNPGTMSSIYSATPTINFATASDYDSNTGTYSVSGFGAGSWLRLDVLSVPSGWSGSFQVMLYGWR
jgi:hypothetical protein